MNALRPLTLVAATALSLVAGSAHADPERGIRLGFKGAFGFGGEIEAEADGFTGSSSDDAEATVGFALFAHYPLLRHFHVGLQTTFGWVNGEAADNANVDATMVVDISAVFKARVPLMNDKLELYAIMPIGLTIAVPPDDLNADNGTGWNVGLQFGASYLVTDAIGILAELGWQGRSATGANSSNIDVTFTMHQFALNFGAFYIF